MLNIDYEKHNEELKGIWESYQAGKPQRIPMIIGINPRIILLDPKYNKNNVKFEQYYNDPATMLDIQFEFQRYGALELPYDHVMGIPENGWYIYPDFQNDIECGWLGAEVKFSDNAVPFTIPFLQKDEDKYNLLKKGMPELFNGLLGKAYKFYEYFKERQKAGVTYLGKPIANIGFTGMGTDGPMTVACMLRGTTEFCIDLYEDEEYARELLEFVTDAAIYRIKGLRKFFGDENVPQSLWFADDSIQLLNCEDYEKFVLPLHKKLLRELTDGSGANNIHLCGDATHHFKKISDELNVKYFDTGFPIDFVKMFNILGPDVTIHGGVHVNELMLSKPGEIKNTVKKICENVKPVSKKFILREANNLSPRTPLENVMAMYEAVKEYGVY